jgi:hypothetical protein
MNSKKKHLLVGCSFTDPTWQSQIPWSIEYSKHFPSYIVAKAGMGIKGICTEALYWLESIRNDVERVIIILPTLWRYDIEVDEEIHLCNSMVDLLVSDTGGWTVIEPARRKWITSGGLHYDKSTAMVPALDFLYRHQGFLVIAKEHFRALERLLDYCKYHKIQFVISAIQDPLDQLVGLDYIRDRVIALLERVEYNSWFKFDNMFIDKFLNHSNHPNNIEHELLCRYIRDIIE